MTTFGLLSFLSEGEICNQHANSGHVDFGIDSANMFGPTYSVVRHSHARAVRTSDCIINTF